MKIQIKKHLLKMMQTTPVGKIDMYAGSIEPKDWLFCRGQAVSKETYAALFDVIGTTYGGDGNPMFNLPDLRDRMPVGAGSSYALNASGGNKNSIIPYHNHGHNIGYSMDESGGGTTSSTSKTLTAKVQSRRYGSGSGTNIIVSTSGCASHTTNDSNKVTTVSSGGGVSSSREVVEYDFTHNHGTPKHKHTGSITGGITAIGRNADGSAASSDNTSNANMPPYRAINFIIYVGGVVHRLVKALQSLSYGKAVVA